MIYGRIIGIFTAVILTGLFPVADPAGRVIVWLFFTAIGFTISIIVSILLGINVSTDQPSEKDGLTYWTEKYGQDLGGEAYEIWLKTLKR